MIRSSQTSFYDPISYSIILAHPQAGPGALGGAADDLRFCYGDAARTVADHRRLHRYLKTDT